MEMIQVFIDFFFFYKITLLFQFLAKENTIIMKQMGLWVVGSDTLQYSCGFSSKQFHAINIL